MTYKENIDEADKQANKYGDLYLHATSLEERRKYQDLMYKERDKVVKLRIAKEKLREKVYVTKKEFPIDIDSQYSGLFQDMIIKPGVKEFSKLVDKKVVPFTKTIVKQSTGRYYFVSGNTIAINPMAGRSALVHELGHAVEMNNPIVKAKAVAFLEARTKGEKAIWLGKPYGPDEVIKKDKFMEAYMGKQYGGATEIISIGLQKMYEDPYKFAKADPGYFDFIWKIARGIFT